jgi:acetyl-CoA synthetase
VSKLTDYKSYADAAAHFSNESLWSLFDGTRSRLNIAHECIDRHIDGDKNALMIAHSDGSDEFISFADIGEASSRVAHYLTAEGIVAEDRVAVMLEPSFAFYATLFGIMKAGAVAVPMFTLFGPDGVRLRVDDCNPKILFTNHDKAPVAEAAGGTRVVVADAAFLRDLERLPSRFDWTTGGGALAVLQYTSGSE